VGGLITITGGKWTTFRLMAEKTVDKAVEYLGRRKPCSTADTPVPGAEQGHYWLGHRLHEVEEAHLQGEIICECELVTRDMVINAVRTNPTITLDDLRRDVRLGMGPCQGGFCTYRAVGILHEIGDRRSEVRDQKSEVGGQESDGENAWDVAYLQSPEHSAKSQYPISNTQYSFNPNLLLRDFLQERWKGVTPILWGRQLKQERLDQLIYLSLMNADHLPESDLKSPLTDFYAFDTTPNENTEIPK